MALVKCEDCGNDRSDQVGSACPKCGNVMEADPGPEPLPPDDPWVFLFSLLLGGIFCVVLGWIFDFLFLLGLGAILIFLSFFCLKLWSDLQGEYQRKLNAWNNMNAETPRTSSPKEGTRIKPVVGVVHPLKSNESNEDGCDDGGDSGGGDGGPAGFTGMG